MQLIVVGENGAEHELAISESSKLKIAFGGVDFQIELTNSCFGPELQVFIGDELVSVNNRIHVRQKPSVVS